MLEEAKGVVQAQAQQGAEVGALFVGAVDLAGPGHRVVHVSVFRGDIEVAQQHQLRVRRQFLRYPGAQRVQPAHLVGELVATRSLPVGEVAANHAHAGHRARDHARLLVGKARDVAHGVGSVHARQQRHAVVGLLPEPLRPVARRLDLRGRELVVRELGLLQHDGVHRVGGQPVQQLRQAHGQ